MDSAEFHAAVYEAVRSIPNAHVTTYGTDILQNLWECLDTHDMSGKVNYFASEGSANLSRIHRPTALKFLQPDTNPPVPWHRVVSSSGAISSRGPGTDGAQRQHDALVAEGIDVVQSRDGEFKVNLREYGWFPAVPVPNNQRADSPAEDN